MPESNSSRRNPFRIRRNPSQGLAAPENLLRRPELSTVPATRELLHQWAEYLDQQRPGSNAVRSLEEVLASDEFYRLREFGSAPQQAPFGIDPANEGQRFRTQLAGDTFNAVYRPWLNIVSAGEVPQLESNPVHPYFLASSNYEVVVSLGRVLREVNFSDAGLLLGQLLRMQNKAAYRNYQIVPDERTPSVGNTDIHEFWRQLVIGKPTPSHLMGLDRMNEPFLAETWGYSWALNKVINVLSEMTYPSNPQLGRLSMFAAVNLHRPTATTNTFRNPHGLMGELNDRLADAGATRSGHIAPGVAVQRRLLVQLQQGDIRGASATALAMTWAFPQCLPPRLQIPILSTASEPVVSEAARLVRQNRLGELPASHIARIDVPARTNADLRDFETQRRSWLALTQLARLIPDLSPGLNQLDRVTNQIDMSLFSVAAAKEALRYEHGLDQSNILTAADLPDYLQRRLVAHSLRSLANGTLTDQRLVRQLCEALEFPAETISTVEQLLQDVQPLPDSFVGRTRLGMHTFYAAMAEASGPQKIRIHADRIPAFLTKQPTAVSDSSIEPTQEQLNELVSLSNQRFANLLTSTAERTLILDVAALDEHLATSPTETRAIFKRLDQLAASGVQVLLHPHTAPHVGARGETSETVFDNEHILDIQSVQTISGRHTQVSSSRAVFHEQTLNANNWNDLLTASLDAESSHTLLVELKTFAINRLKRAATWRNQQLSSTAGPNAGIIAVERAIALSSGTYRFHPWDHGVPGWTQAHSDLTPTEIRQRLVAQAIGMRSTPAGLREVQAAFENDPASLYYLFESMSGDYRDAMLATPNGARIVALLDEHRDTLSALRTPDTREAIVAALRARRTLRTEFELAANARGQVLNPKLNASQAAKEFSVNHSTQDRWLALEVQSESLEGLREQQPVLFDSIHLFEAETVEVDIATSVPMLWNAPSAVETWLQARHYEQTDIEKIRMLQDAVIEDLRQRDVSVELVVSPEALGHLSYADRRSTIEHWQTFDNIRVRVAHPEPRRLEHSATTSIATSDGVTVLESGLGRDRVSMRSATAAETNVNAPKQEMVLDASSSAEYLEHVKAGNHSIPTSRFWRSASKGQTIGGQMGEPDGPDSIGPADPTTPTPTTIGPNSGAPKPEVAQDVDVTNAGKGQVESTTTPHTPSPAKPEDRIVLEPVVLPPVQPLPAHAVRPSQRDSSKRVDMDPQTPASINHGQSGQPKAVQTRRAPRRADVLAPRPTTQQPTPAAPEAGGTRRQLPSTAQSTPALTSQSTPTSRPAPTQRPVPTPRPVAAPSRSPQPAPTQVRVSSETPPATGDPRTAEPRLRHQRPVPPRGTDGTSTAQGSSLSTNTADPRLLGPSEASVRPLTDNNTRRNTEEVEQPKTAVEAKGIVLQLR